RRQHMRDVRRIEAAAEEADDLFGRVRIHADIKHKEAKKRKETRRRF
ncbi:hypothetical protein HYR69_02515, partial [Candidatus Sumerlaeota bacterium]|nr:hypothetical protein [Candidatus Sumerlaeota bacterium]